MKRKFTLIASLLTLLIQTILLVSTIYVVGLFLVFLIIGDTLLEKLINFGYKTPIIGSVFDKTFNWVGGAGILIALTFILFLVLLIVITNNVRKSAYISNVSYKNSIALLITFIVLNVLLLVLIYWRGISLILFNNNLIVGLILLIILSTIIIIGSSVLIIIDILNNNKLVLKDAQTSIKTSNSAQFVPIYKQNNSKQFQLDTENINLNEIDNLENKNNTNENSQKIIKK